MTGLMIVARRPDDHHKGPGEIMRIPYGDRVPPGVLIGKDAVITIETVKEKEGTE